jgi:uncharacterized protein
MPRQLPIFPEPQIIPSEVCCQCEVCCRFPEVDSVLRPYFTAREIRDAIAHGLDSSRFSDRGGCQVTVVPNPREEGFICPAFDPDTHHCRIYAVRPLDCRLYPFALMWNGTHETILLGWDPKCPFLLSEAGGDPSLYMMDIDRSTLKLPQSLWERVDAIADFLESDSTMEYLAASPQLITAFQSDVVIIKPLDRLTAALNRMGRQAH